MPRLLRALPSRSISFGVVADIDAARKYLLENLDQWDPRVTDWAFMALEPTTPVRPHLSDEFIEAYRGEYFEWMAVTDVERRAIAMTAIGLTLSLLEQEHLIGVVEMQQSTPSQKTDWMIWALIAFKVTGLSDDPEVIPIILDLQDRLERGKTPDGGFGIDTGSPLAITDLTAAGMLAGFDATAWLSTHAQGEGWSFDPAIYTEVQSLSTIYGLLALGALGHEPALEFVNACQDPQEGYCMYRPGEEWWPDPLFGVGAESDPVVLKNLFATTLWLIVFTALDPIRRFFGLV
jgi:hypothetical protein